MLRPRFRLRSLFILTAIVAVGCAVGPRAFDAVRLGAARGGSLDTAVLSVTGLAYAVWGALMMDKRSSASWSTRLVFYGAALVVAGALSALDAPTPERHPAKFVTGCWLRPSQAIVAPVGGVTLVEPNTVRQKVVTRRMLSQIRRVSRQPRRPALHGRSRRRLVQCPYDPPPPSVPALDTVVADAGRRVLVRGKVVAKTPSCMAKRHGANPATRVTIYRFRRWSRCSRMGQS
jgi:hypothetical protein